ncbi:MULTISPECIES: M16 family metallopeptidase [unclassified Brevundimonas]|uniref:M16 family metallopeptidase n=1 Tax=unclassified Brevundimonas TaxID=2622653 RepID=UPI0025BC6B4B|nr:MULTISPECIES: pitrilysin family protein [unclassified Brevundimonas]
MKTRHLFCAAASVLALSTAVPALATPVPAVPAAATQATSTVTVPPLGYTRRVLANGLEVYSRPNSGTASVAVHMWYRVGGKDDPSGRSGFAHLFEHLMFKATENVPNETFDRLTEDVGGYNNAFTSSDVTAYHAVVPANHLERILFAEADRMGTLVVDEENFKSERDVVKEEYRQGVLASPYGRLFGLFVSEAFYTEHPYRRPTIGSIEELEAATVEEVRRFHSTYYRPDNAILIVDGNFDQAQLDRWVDQYFGPLKKGATPIPANNVTEPEMTGPKDRVIYAPNVPLEGIFVGWHTVPASHPDTPALSVLAGILSTGESSRLYKSLVYDAQAASEVDASSDVNQQAGTFNTFAILSDGKTAEDGKALIEREFERLRTSPVSEAELVEAKNELVFSTLRSREGAQGRASALGWALIRTNDPTTADTQIQKIQQVTAADIQRVANQYLTPQRQVTLRYKAADEAHPETPQTINMTAPVKVDDLAPAGTPSVLKPEGQRARIPQPAADIIPATPSVTEFKLDNGMRVVVAPKPGLPLLAASLTFKNGSSSDPEGKSGTAELVAKLLTQGTNRLSAPQVATQIEQLGAVLNANSDDDFISVYVMSPTNVFDQAIGLASQLVIDPAFSPEELDRQRLQTLDNLRISLNQPSSLASMATVRLNFAGTPYGNVPSERSLNNVTRDDLVRYHDTYMRPDQVVLTFAGDVTEASARRLAEQAFGNWRAQSNAAPAKVAVAPNQAEPRVVVINLPDAGQAAVTVSQRSVPRNDDSFLALDLGNTLLGGSYTSRLNQEIRIKRGLSYGVWSDVGAQTVGGMFRASTQTKNETAAEVAELLVAELAKMGETAAPETELSPRRAILSGGFGRNLESVTGLAALVADLAAYDLPLSDLSTYATRLSQLSPEDVRAAFADKIPANRSNIVITGNAALFLDKVREKYPNVEVINATDLNLDSSTLR